MKKLILILILFFCFNIKTIIFPFKNHHYFFSDNTFNPKFQSVPFISISASFISYLLNGERNTVKLQYPFSDSDFYSSVVNYDVQGNINIYSNQNLIVQLSLQNSFPRIVNPYIIYISENQTHINIAKISSPKNILKSMDTRNTIIAWASSKDGHYLAVGDLEGYVYVYDNFANKIFSFKDDEIPAIQGLSIGGKSDLYVVGGYESKKLLMYNITSHKKKEWALDQYFNTKINLINSQDFLFIPYKKGFDMFVKKHSSLSRSKRILPVFYRLIQTKDVKSTDTSLLLLYKVDENTYYAQVTNKKNQIVDSFYFSSDTIPTFKKLYNKYYLSYYEGLIEIC